MMMAAAIEPHIAANAMIELDRDRLGGSATGGVFASGRSAPENTSCTSRLPPRVTSASA
jgi:hypothetical protein